MLRAFIRNSLIYGAATILTRGITIFLVPVYTRVLEPREYGAIDLLTVIAALVASVVPLEIVQAVARHLPDQESEEDKRRLASTALWFAVVSYLLFLVAAWWFARAIAVALLGSPTSADVIRVASLSMVGNGLFYVIQSQLHWRLRARDYAFSGVVYSLASVAASVVLVVVFDLGVIGVFAGQTVGAVIGTALAVRLTAGYMGLEFDGAVLRTMLRFSVPLVPSTLGVVVALYVDRLAINALVGLAAVGVFGVAYRVASLVQLVLVGFQSAITPLVYATHRDATMPRDLERIFRAFVALSLLIWLGLGLFADEIIAVFTTPEYRAAASVVPILAPAVTLAGCYVFMPGLVIVKRTTSIAAINIGAGALNLVLNLALIPQWGIQGAAAATLISAAASFGATVITSQRAYFVPHDWPRIGTAVVGVLVLVVGGTLIGDSGAGRAAKVALWLIGAGWMLMIGLVRGNEIGSARRAILCRIRATRRKGIGD